MEGEDRAGLQDDFMSLLKTTQPSSNDPIVINMDHDSAIRTSSEMIRTNGSQCYDRILDI